MNNEARFLLDRELFEDLKAYLHDKRSALRDALLFSISLEKLKAPPLLPEPMEGKDPLEFALSEFENRWRSLSNEELKKVDYESFVERFSIILWNYVEILEGMGRELFEQAAKIPIDRLDQELYDRLELAKYFLWDRLKEIDRFLVALEASLKRFHQQCLSARPFKLLPKIRAPFHKALDPDLMALVKKGELYLFREFKRFAKEYGFLKRVEGQIESEQVKFQGYQILHQLNPADERLYLRVFRLLKLWDKSKRGSLPLNRHAAASLKQAISFGKFSSFTKDYLKEIKGHLFDFARRHRNYKEMGSDIQIALWRSEVAALVKVIKDFRAFTLAEEQQKQPRGILGWIKGPLKVSRPIKELNLRIEEAKLVDVWLQQLFDAQEPGEDNDENYGAACFKRASKILEDMGQPLISKTVMKAKVDELLKTLKEANELTSALPDTSQLMLEKLLRAFKVDAKHEVLTENRAFWPLWEVHHGLSYYDKSPAHQRRMKVYKRVVQHLKQWMTGHELNHHLQDVEHEIHDIQECLQEFFHQTKQINSLLEKWEFKKELLEERVFFASFFSYLNQHNHEGKRVKGELAFLEKYFNAIDDNLF